VSEPSPRISQHALGPALEGQYGLRGPRLIYLQRAWIAHCYAVDAADGRRYFLKAYDDLEQALSYTRDLAFYLSLSHQLCAQQILPAACPLRARDGRLFVPLDGGLLILFDWIEGRLVEYGPLPDEILVRLGTLVGTLHTSTPRIALPGAPREGFEIPFEEDLLRGLDDLSQVGAGNRAAQQTLQDLLVPRRDQVLALLDRLHGLQAAARAQNAEMVVCHTDLHGGNLILDAEGTLHILDWEGALLAPAEHDLYTFAGDRRFEELFVPRYREAWAHAGLQGTAEPDPTRLAFYMYRRNLEDLTDYVVRIMYEENGPAQDDEDLQGLADDCIGAWPAIASTLCQMRQNRRRSRSWS
jgi:Ser/Thr protein kinase RdoA (MazF antagonist)